MNVKKPKFKKIVIASIKNIEKYDAFSVEFLNKILGIKEFFITDESSIYDFDSKFVEGKAIHPDMDKILKKIKKVYGVDVSKIKDLILYKIFDKIMKTKRGVAQPG